MALDPCWQGTHPLLWLSWNSDRHQIQQDCFPRDGWGSSSSCLCWCFLQDFSFQYSTLVFVVTLNSSKRSTISLKMMEFSFFKLLAFVQVGSMRISFGKHYQSGIRPQFLSVSKGPFHEQVHLPWCRCVLFSRLGYWQGMRCLLANSNTILNNTRSTSWKALVSRSRTLMFLAFTILPPSTAGTRIGLVTRRKLSRNTVKGGTVSGSSSLHTAPSPAGMYHLLILAIAPDSISPTYLGKEAHLFSKSPFIKILMPTTGSKVLRTTRPSMSTWRRSPSSSNSRTTCSDREGKNNESWRPFLILLT